MWTQGAGHEVDGVAYVVVETRLGVPRAVEEMVAIAVHLPATGAHRAGASREQRKAVGPSKGQDTGEVAQAVFPDLAARCEKGEGDQAGEQAWEKGADMRGAEVKERVKAMVMMSMHDLAQDAVDGSGGEESADGGGA